MGQPAERSSRLRLSREICQRTGSKAVIDGSIAQIGTQYLLIAKAVNCVSGESLASTEAQASDKSHVLDALGKTASEIRSKLGESLSTVQKFDAPLEQATTSSLEALQAYSLGRKTIVEVTIPLPCPCSSGPSAWTRISPWLTLRSGLAITISGKPA